MYKIIDNYHEIILQEDYRTEQEADQAIKELIKGHKQNGQNYDYDVTDINVGEITE